MTRYWLASAAALAMMTGVALAQTNSSETTTITQPVTVVPGPSYSETKTQNAIDRNGVETKKVETFDKSQSYSSGAGELNATTSIRTTGQTTTVAPPQALPSVTTSKTTTTTTE